MENKHERQHEITRRKFLKASAAISAATAATVIACKTKYSEKNEFFQVKKNIEIKNNIQSACPYCGVGCGTLIQVENGKIVGITPDKDHPTNKGVQCIKGLTANEPIYYKDRLTKVLIRKDVYAEWKKPDHGDLEYISKTKGRFDDGVWDEITYSEAEEINAHKIVHLIKKYGGNSISLYGSGQLTLEGQYVENKFMKGLIGSNTVEANARMCMTSAVTAYFETLGSDTPPTCYDDFEMCDFVSFWGHNAREAHPILFWRVADYKKKADIPTLVVDPRLTGTVQGFYDINPANSYHAWIEPNGDISFLNSIAYVLLKEHPDVIARDFMASHTTGAEDYMRGIIDNYSPEKTNAVTGLDPSFVRKIASIWADATRKGNARGTGGVMTGWGIGYNQHIHGQHNAISIINLHLLTGNIGRPGCGPHSQTGQPNAMGERLTGGLTGRLPFNQGIYEKGVLNEKAVLAFSKAWHTDPEVLKAVGKAENQGMAVGMMERALLPETDERRLRAMFLIYATHIDLPETKTLVRPALSNIFVVVQDIYAHAPNLLYADIVIPAATWGEVGGTYVQSERKIYVTDKAAEPPLMGDTKKDPYAPYCKPDLDIVIDKGKSIAKALGLDGEKIFPYRKNENGFYDVEEIFIEMANLSKDSDADFSGIVDAAREDNKRPYDIIREIRGVHWPAPTAEIARKGGYQRRYMGQEQGWNDKPYGNFRTSNGKAHMKLCQQDYSKREELTKELSKAGIDKDFLFINNFDLLIKARDYAITPELPDFDERGKHYKQVSEGKYPFWLGLGVVYEHFHTAKTIRSVTGRRLLLEQYVEMHEEDAKENALKDGDWIRITTRRGSYEARVSIGIHSIVKPARNRVKKGYLFSPWNLSVADSADPEKNKWLVNAVSHRAFDPVSGQADFKKLAARIEKIERSI